MCGTISTAPPEIIGALGLTEGASLQDAARAIEQQLSGEALRDEIVRAVKSETRALRDEIRARRVGPRVADDLTDDQALSAPGTSPGIRELPGARPIAVHRLQTAAGSGALDLDETVKSYAYFRHEWLSRQGLVADRCSIIGVMGESMEPTLPEGCVILLDRNQRHRRRLAIGQRPSPLAGCAVAGWRNDHRRSEVDGERVMKRWPFWTLHRATRQCVI